MAILFYSVLLIPAHITVVLAVAFGVMFLWHFLIFNKFIVDHLVRGGKASAQLIGYRNKENALTLKFKDVNKDDVEIVGGAGMTS